MDTSLMWLLVGIGLIVAEVATGSFYLLFLGIAALAGAAIAYFGFGIIFQAVVATTVAVLGVLAVHHRHRTREAVPMPAIDLNQPVVWEGWIDRNNAMGRVKYRGASWDAHLHDVDAPELGAILYIVTVDGGMLHVAKAAK